MSSEDVDSAKSADALACEVSRLHERLAEAERAIRARDDFLAIASHELRNPMNALGLQLSAIQRLAQRDGETQLGEELQRARRILDRYVRRATTLLDVTRLNGGNFVIQRERIELRALVAASLDVHAEEAAFRNVTVTADVDEGIVGLWDEVALEEIFSNLLTNAFKYGRGSPITIRGWRDAGQACLSVADQGPGIDERNRQRIFEKFEQVVSGPRVQGGFGLGLWIASRLAHAHGGLIDVESHPGRGSCFTIRLPLAPPHTDTTFELAT
ncbi:sensor histidine kinase [Caldimonas tepidiphila]|uniref:sensor histidine kinase n=1 Tax=Caldimonas tepidiphila TaxID=2315841 RepID=UPI0014747A6B|nr:HAMP domain-containing sensor histidine kinase [Caldimonas tepidiphila]